MKLNYDLPVCQLAGEPFTNERGKPLTLRETIVMSCSVALQGDEALSLVDKFKVGEIAATAYKGLDLTTEQIAIVKDRSGKGIGNPVMLYVFHNMLEATPAPIPTLTKKRK